MSDIFREVDEDVRRDRLHKLWKQYGSYVIIACVALVLGTAGRTFWRDYQVKQRLADSARYEQAATLLEEGRETEAINAFAELARDAGGGYAVLGRLREAAARAQAGDLSGAVRAYDALAEDGGADPIYRDLARLLAALLLVDDSPAQEIEHRLEPLLGEASPWQFSARETVAIAVLGEGRREEARERLQALADDLEAPAGVRGRASELLAAMKSES